MLVATVHARPKIRERKDVASKESNGSGKKTKICCDRINNISYSINGFLTRAMTTVIVTLFPFMSAKK